jgi:DNA primase
VDYNQNARDHTIAAAYSVRGFPDGRVSTPVHWEEVGEVDPHDFTIFTVPARFAEVGDLHADIDDHVFDIEPLRQWADRDEANGLTSTTGRGDGDDPETDQNDEEEPT